MTYDYTRIHTVKAMSVFSFNLLKDIKDNKLRYYFM